MRYDVVLHTVLVLPNMCTHNTARPSIHPTTSMHPPPLQVTFDDDDAATAATDDLVNLPEWACAYCGIHRPACVVQCVTTGRWFCNGRANRAASCIVTHLVKAKCKEVRLHSDSPLGDTVLECYSSGTKNVFALGFVPVKAEHTVVLLARDTPANAPAIKDLQLDLGQWAPLIEDRAFVDWLVAIPTDQVWEWGCTQVGVYCCEESTVFIAIHRADGLCTHTPTCL